MFPNYSDSHLLGICHGNRDISYCSWISAAGHLPDTAGKNQPILDPILMLPIGTPQ